MKRQWPEPEGSSTRCKRCTWSEAEDQLLLEMSSKPGVVDWAEVAKAMHGIQPRRGPAKTAKQCRERWHNRVNPVIKQAPWSPEEEDKFFQLHAKYGAKWSEIATELEGRTDNTIKNFFYCRLRKIARRIKKGMISDDMKTSAKEVEHTLYLIKFLRSYYVSDPSGARRPPADKYIAEMIHSSTISAGRINSYLKEYLASVKISNQGSHGHDKISDTDDSLTKIQAAPTETLPTISQSNSPSVTAIAQSKSFEELYTLAQLDQFKRLYPYKEFVSLPLPNALTVKPNKLRQEEDSFKPTFSFTQTTGNVQMFSACSSLLPFYIFCMHLNK